MQFSNIFPHKRNLEDECLAEENIFECKPFKIQDIDSSSEDLGNTIEENENPFTDSHSIFKKVKPTFNGEARPFSPCSSQKLKESLLKPLTHHNLNSQSNWSRKSFSLIKNNGLIRSAPLSFGSSVWDLESNGERITLPVLGCGKSDSIKRISGITLINLLTKQIDVEFSIIDARFKYEYEGGHIFNALNINNEFEIQKQIKSHNIVILYCEFSSERGPGLAKKLRNIDRFQNEYPRLNYPEIYILDGGYKKFYQNFPEFCTPQNYVQMHDKRFREECVYSQKTLKLNKS